MFCQDINSIQSQQDIKSCFSSLQLQDSESDSVHHFPNINATICKNNFLLLLLCCPGLQLYINLKGKSCKELICHVNCDIDTCGYLFHGVSQKGAWILNYDMLIFGKSEFHHSSIAGSLLCNTWQMLTLMRLESHEKPTSFAEMLTQSDPSHGGEFSASHYWAEA
ncbi:hypothetical protein VNO77_33398 [Canavalia gladiata]|uniref:Uncharacterized protein n=1 Tax=Canavalia gladiata TaxID=3824 RepID=A0AAN9PWC2_CANGL